MKSLRDYVLAKNGLPSRDAQLIQLEKQRLELEKENEIKEMLAWFATYDQHVAEYSRCKRLGVSCEHNIIELDITAETKRSRSQELRK